jgi:pimeloyl-ACP methyl ester carboxylesterase
MRYILLLAFSFISINAFGANSNSIDRLEKIEVNGSHQYLLLRSENVERPVVLFVHGGPGWPLMFFSRAFDGKLLKNFTVVHWDQRDTGKSYDPNLPINTFTAEQIAEDGLVVVAYLKKKFNKSKIVLVGHSWGTIVASMMAKKRPSDFVSYVSVGTIADTHAGDELSYAFLKDKVSHDSEKRIKVGFEKMGPPPWREFSLLVIRNRLMMKFKGSLFSLSRKQLFSAIEKNTEYSKEDMKNLDIGMEKIWNQILPFLLPYKAIESVKELDVPLIFVHGRHDMATPTKLSKDYFNLLIAPKGKEWVEFSESAHFPMYEEPSKFLGVLKRAAKL